MQLEHRFLEIQDLLKELLPFISAWDIDVIKGNRIDHPWIESIYHFSPEQKFQFDGARESSILQDRQWLKVIKMIKDLVHFKKLSSHDHHLNIMGKKKKQHEFNQLYSLLENDKGKSVVDFGGGVGNLAYFLESNLDMQVNVLEKDETLITTGIKRLSRFDSKISFTQKNITSHPNEFNLLKDSQLAIGLHTCGNFAHDMFKICIKNNSPYIINFGCCYSKIQDDNYHLSKLSDKTLLFNSRALCAATLGFSPVSREIYDYRNKILTFKFSFYHWLEKNATLSRFFSMSNSRRNLYKNDFAGFMRINLKKLFPQLKVPNDQDLTDFLDSEENQNLNDYFMAYYAIARYVGELLEAYLLCDRALFLAEQNYECDILEVFDSKISPRNKAIVAKKLVTVS